MKNIRKSDSSISIFTRLENWLRSKSAFQILPERYILRVLFLFLLGILYEWNTHFFEKTAREITALERDVDALRVDYTTLNSSYMLLIKQSEVARRVAALGLREVPKPPVLVPGK